VNVGQVAKEWYEQNEPEGSFTMAILRCLFHGLIVRRPDFFLLAEPVFTDGRQIIATNLPANCWWCHFVCAPVGTKTTYDFMAEAPYPLDYVGFKRRNKVKIYRWENIIEKDVYYGRSPAGSTSSSA
jgi:hypothetical protein